jgi:hypothetical protein
MPYYTKEYLLKEVTPSYKEVSKYITEWFNIAEKYEINLILADIPFCCLPDKEKYKKTDDYIYQTRLKIDVDENELDRKNISPRMRSHVETCEKCIYKKKCW